MKPARKDLRAAFGLALRQLRQSGSFSLDDVQHATAGLGVAVSRSHLSRVETGQADLSLPRYLALMRALGSAPGSMVDRLDGLLDGRQLDAAEAKRAADEALQKGDLMAACSFFRMSASAIKSDEAALLQWADCEFRQGRWRRADAVLQRIDAAGSLSIESLAVQRTAALLAAGQSFWAGVMVRAAGRSDLGDAAALCCELAVSNFDQILSALPRACPTSQGALRSLIWLVGACAYRRKRQFRAAAQALTTALECAPQDRCVRAEGMLTEAAIAVERGQPRAALPALDSARALAREMQRPELLARCHERAAWVLRVLGEERESREAQRAAHAVRRRTQAEPPAAVDGPIALLFEVSRTPVRELISAAP
jgi:tetratricopeptide (TPR) repeat protein